MIRWILLATAAVLPLQLHAQIKKTTASFQNASSNPCVVTYDTNIVITPAFHMTANGAGPVASTVGYENSPAPQGFDAYSADYYRDVLGAAGSVRDIPGGMQTAGGVFFIMAGGAPNATYEDAQVRWFRGGVLYQDYNYDASYEIRFTASGGMSYERFQTGQLIAVPFEVWDLGADKNSPSDDVRMVPIIFDEDLDNAFNFHGDHTASSDSNDPYCDWIYFNYPSWNSTPGDAGYQEFIANPAGYSLTSNERMARIVIVNYNRRQGETSTKANDGPWDAMPEVGTIFRIDNKLDTLITENFNNVGGTATAVAAVNQSLTVIETFDSVLVVTEATYQHRSDPFLAGILGDSIFWNSEWFIVQDVQYANSVGASIGGLVGQVGFQDEADFSFNTTIGTASVTMNVSFVINEYFDCMTIKGIAGNNWRWNLNSSGQWAYDPGDGDGNGSNAGGYFPASTGQSIVYAGGLLIGTKKNQVPVVSEIQYASEFTTGAIRNAEPSSIDQLTFGDSIQTVYVIDPSLASPDYTNWPSRWGAPLSSGLQPLLISQQDSWNLLHDADTTLSSDTLSSSPGLGIEVQRRTHSFTTNGLDNTVFLRWILTNKSDFTYDSVFVGLWSDPDVQTDASKDVSGCDTVLNLVYAYNQADEPFTLTMNQAAVGYQFLSGTGTNGRLYAFRDYTNGTDPVNNSERYNLLKGLFPWGDPDPAGRFLYTGDPVTGTGSLDTTGSDERILATVGPFRMKPGQIVQLIFAVTGAEGTTRQNSVSEVRNTASNVKIAYPSIVEPLFKDPVAYTQGSVNVTNTTATLQGSVLANGLATDVSIEYGTTLAYGNTQFVTTTSEDTSIEVQELLNGLQANTTYHYRFVVSNSAGMSYGQDQVFTTASQGLPFVANSFVSDVTPHSANLSAVVNPGGDTTTVIIESGTSTSYTRVDTLQTLTGSVDDTVSLVLTELQENTTYHYRVTATNSFGTIVTADSSFKTGLVPLGIWLSIHQNPVLNRYADVFVLGDTILQQTPIVTSTVNGITTPIVMQQIPGQQQYKGELKFAVPGVYSLQASAVSVNGSTIDLNRDLTIALAKADAVTHIQSPEGRIAVKVPSGAFKEDVFLLAGVTRQAQQERFDVSSFLAEKEVEITIRYDPTAFDDVTKLFLYRRDGNGWTQLRSQVYLKDSKIKTRTKQLGQLKLAVDPTFTGTNVVPTEFSLRRNYPNPFNPTTTIGYDLAQDGTTRLEVYNLLGQRVRSLVTGFQLAGTYQVSWNGQNDVGHQVASGVYFYRLQAGRYVKTNKMLLLK